METSKRTAQLVISRLGQVLLSAAKLYSLHHQAVVRSTVKPLNPLFMRVRSVIIPLAFVTTLGRAPTPITVYIAGDSTAAEKLPEKRPETGWGEMLGQYFRPDEVRIANRALNGRSTRTFISEGKWRAITDSLKAGDYVFIQFGHNDEVPSKVGSYTPPADFTRNLTLMVTEVRARNAIPVLLTPVYRRKFDKNGRIEDTHGEYPDLTRGIAAKLDVPLIDSFGADSSTKLFLQLEKGENANYPDGVHDNTHFRPLGAELMARLVVDGIRALKLGLATHLKSAPI
jgi:lysophospholipase L1-like esterase